MTDHAPPTFPVDDVTLAVLAAAVECDEEDGHSHLFEVLDFGDQSWSPHAVIAALVAEVQRLRSERAP